MIKKAAPSKSNPAQTRSAALSETVQNIAGYLVKEEVATRLRKEPRTIERWMRQGIIPYLKLGRGKRATVLFKWDEIERSLQARFGVGGNQN